MKKWLMLLLIVTILFGLTGFTRAQCPEDPGDNGVCDTLRVEIYPKDQVHLPGSPLFVRFPLYVAHDVPDPSIDSISAFVILLYFTHSNTAKYCSLSGYWNNTNVYPFPDLDRSIFRHYIEWGDTLIHNWMMDLSQQLIGLEWDTRILDLGDGTRNFLLALFPTGAPDRRFEEGSGALLATMTFKLEDTTTICVDSCAPMGMRLSFSRADAVTYIPRHNMEYCVSIGFSEHGDANGDGEVNVMHALYMLNYLFRQGPPPVSFEAGDANCDGDHGALDVVYLLNYLFRGGPPPGCP
jgi:hypothetical protein